MRQQEYPGTRERNVLHNQPELQRSTQHLFLCPKQLTSSSPSVLRDTYPEAEAYSNRCNGWFYFCINVWDVGLDFKVDPAVGNRTPCHGSLAQQAC